MGGTGSTTYITNQYHEDIWAKAEADRSYVILQDIATTASIARGSGGARVKTSYNWEYAEKEGFTKIAPGTHLGFQPDCGKPTVYITVLTGNGEVISNAFPIQEDFSVMVNSEGCLRRVKHGTLTEEV